MPLESTRTRATMRPSSVSSQWSQPSKSPTTTWPPATAGRVSPRRASASWRHSEAPVSRASAHTRLWSSVT